MKALIALFLFKPYRLMALTMPAADSKRPSVGKRIHVIGAIGSGKSTTGNAIAHRLGLPFIDLDAIRHGPNWIDKPDEEFKTDVLGTINKAAQGWVVAGNYFQSLDLSVVSHADTVIWLRIPIWRAFPRLLWRTLLRSWTKEELWNGNRETWQQSFLSRDSVLIEALVKAHRRQHIEGSVLSQLSNETTIIQLRKYREIDQFLRTLTCHFPNLE